MSSPFRAIIRFRAPDRPGILGGVSSALAATGWDIREASVYGDPGTSIFFTRMELTHPHGSIDALRILFDPVARDLQLDWDLHDADRKMRVLIAVSKFEHCLIDLLHKTAIGALPIEIVGVVSNHETARSRTEWHGLPFFSLPITKDAKAEQEAAFSALIESTGTELLVLARYMQILSDDFSARVSGRCINIHHSFLPSFKGAKPYHQAHARGVKLIGATAHYVTADLDEGPIIEQDVRRVTHATTADEMVAIGREVEASVLSRAVRWHAEHRVQPSGNRTVVL